jgi:GNAT superfamily N-acetyltransferase
VTESRYRSEPLGKDHNRADFSCGVDGLDRYLRQQAGQDYRRSLAVPYVLVDGATAALVGYYTLSTFSIHTASLPDEFTHKLARYELYPAILIGRLAVDLRYRGRGFGSMLLVDALNRCLVISRQVGAVAVVVDAKDDAARAFYEHHEFRRLTDHEHRLFLPMATVAQLGPGEGPSAPAGQPPSR